MPNALVPGRNDLAGAAGRGLTSTAASTTQSACYPKVVLCPQALRMCPPARESRRQRLPL